MTSVQHHIIRRQILDIEVAGAESDGLELQRRLAYLCQDWLAPALEQALERSVPGDEHWIIERLEVDAGSISLETFERDLVEAVTQAIERQLKERSGGVSLASMARGAAARAASWPTENSPREPVPLDAMGSSALIRRRTDARSIHEAFLHFLETGILPWWFHLPARKTLEDVVLASWRAAGQPAQFGRTLIDAMASAGARTRLVRQFSDEFLWALLPGLSTEGVPAIRQILAEMERHDLTPEMFGRLSEQLWQAAFTAVASGRRLTAKSVVAECMYALPTGEGRPEPRLIERIAQLWPETQSRTSEAEQSMLSDGAQSRDRGTEQRMLRDGTRSRNTRAEERTASANGAPAAERVAPASPIDLEEGVYVECAGLVLLHPFLPRLFEALCITRDDKLVQLDRALCLLHFLAAGERRAPEYTLILPKLLCDLPLEAPVETPVTLTTAEEEEAIALLEAVIRHWDALGDASVDALRGTFLARPGKFSRRGNGDDVLQVEPQSFDILLDRLPWGIGMIQLPWMEKLLWVEWRF